jgi:site-specific DNA-methyltransferase (adenine-specific)
VSDPYYSDDLVTLYHGDCLDLAPVFAHPNADALLMDPPYGIAYRSNRPRMEGNARSIEGDGSTALRDLVLAGWGCGPALVFGTWRVSRPERTHTRLIWDTKGALGMGNLSVPWKPSDQEIYVLGYGFEGRRTSNVLCHAPVQSAGRLHPHEKPIPLLLDLLSKCPTGWTIADPFSGSGSTLVAAKQMGLRAIGVELEERYCEIAAKRLAQDTLFGEIA